MKKNRLLARIILTIFSAAFIGLTFIGTISYAESESLWDSYTVPSTRQKPRLLDKADLLSNDEEKALEANLDALSQKWKSNVCILTVDSHTGPIQDFADDYFDYNGFGADYNDSGILFMLSMEDREWAISTCGEAIQVFTDYGQSQMMYKMSPDLGANRYYDAFNKFVEVSDYYYELYSKGTPYDVNYKEPLTIQDYIKAALMSLLGGLVVALIPIAIMASKLKTVKRQLAANDYRSHDGLVVSTHLDNFVRSSVTRHRIDTDSGGGGRSGGHSGGSSTHSSSSGHTHGGSHGHF